MDQRLETLIGVQLLLLAIVSAGIVALDPEKAASLKLYEFFGALLASIITVFGLREMRDLTS